MASKLLDLALASLLPLGVGCDMPPDSTSGASEAALAVSQPTHVTVTILGVTVAPVDRPTGLPWDGPPFADATVKVVTNLLDSLAPQEKIATDLLSLLARGWIEATQPPDVRGVVQWRDNSGQLLASGNLAERDDTYTPGWVSTWTQVPLDGSELMAIGLEDVDLGEELGFDTNDPIGAVVLGADDFRRALATGGVVQVPVADRARGNGNILYVALEVTPE